MSAFSETNHRTSFYQWPKPRFLCEAQHFLQVQDVQGRIFLAISKLEVIQLKNKDFAFNLELTGKCY